MSEKAFSLNADSRFVYESQSHVATRESLLAGLRRREGLLVLTGQIGTGKTTLCRAVLGDLGRNTYSSLVPDPFASREDLLKMLLIDFGVLSIQELTTGTLRQASRTELGYLLLEFLDSLSRDVFVVVMIDEAHNLSVPLIEETRLLSDTLGAKGRLQIVFVGQPELLAKLKSPEMRQVDQRVCGYHRLDPLEREAVAGYVEHRLRVAGNSNGGALFSTEIIEHLHARTGGVPRLINRICDRSLQFAYERRAAHVDREILDAALLDVGSATLSPTWDSIMAAATPAPAPQTSARATPEPPATPIDTPAPPAPAPDLAAAIDGVNGWALDDDQESFKQEIEHWVTKDLGPSSRPVVAEPSPSSIEPRNTRAQQRVPRIGSTLSSRRTHRSETYAHKMWRRWTMRAVIALAVFVAANAVMIGMALAPGLLPLGELPQVPDAPAPLVAGLTPPAPPSSDAPSAGASNPAATAEYLVAVGLFADQGRANTLADTLTAAGFPVVQRPLNRRGQQFQQIALGPFSSRTDAAAHLQRLQQLGAYADAAVIDLRRDPFAQ